MRFFRAACDGVAATGNWSILAPEPEVLQELPSNFLIKAVFIGLEQFRVVRLSPTVSLGKNVVYGPETPILACSNVLEAGGMEFDHENTRKTRFSIKKCGFAEEYAKSRPDHSRLVGTLRNL